MDKTKLVFVSARLSINTKSASTSSLIFVIMTSVLKLIKTRFRKRLLLTVFISYGPASLLNGMDTDETVRSYKQLSRVEQAFRSFKTIDLMVRPIRHRTEDRVRAHIFLCMLALLCTMAYDGSMAPFTLCRRRTRGQSLTRPCCTSKTFQFCNAESAYQTT